MATYPSINRVSDIAVNDAWAIAILGPRQFTGEEVAVITSELLALESFLVSLCNFCLSVRSHQAYPGGTDASKMVWHKFVPSEGTNIEIGLLQLQGVALERTVAAAAPTANAEDAIEIPLYYDGVQIAVLNGPMAQNVATLRALPGEVYHVMGSLLEEIAASVYKGRADATFATVPAVQSIIRLQDKIVSRLIDKSADAAIFAGDSTLSGIPETNGKLMARGISHTVLNAIAPTIHDWVLEVSPAGTKAYTTTEV